MATAKRLPDLPTATTVAGGDWLLISQGGVSKKAAVSQLPAAAPAPAPSPAQAVTVQVTAGEALGGHRAVALNASGQAVYASAGRVTGVTQGAAAAGAPVIITCLGLLSEPTWTWVPDAPVYVTAAGVLTQAVPTAGTLHIVGTAMSATALYVQPREPIALT